MSDRKDLPPPTANNFGARVREEVMRLMGKLGNPADQAVTVRDLVTAGLAKLKPSGGFEASPDIGGSSAPELDLTPPPQPTGFAASAAISHVLIEHDAPTYTQGGGHGRTRVYGVTYTTGPLPTFAQAVELGQFSGTVWAMPSNPATTWRLWIKWETADGVVSAVPAGGTNGLAVTTGQDVSKMVQAMTGAGNPFTILTTPTTIGGFLYPAGTYSVQSFIIDGQITNAKIANLAVDNGKIASVSVDKLTAGSLAVGQHIQSTSYTAGSAGWRINADGTAELNNVTVRGTVVASAGNIGGNTINATGIQSPNYVAGTAGWRINSSGTAELNNVTVRGTVVATNGQFSGTIFGGSATEYGNGIGFFSGVTTGYRWRVGDPAGARIQWTGTAIEVYNSSNQLTFASGGITAAQVSGLGAFATLSQLNSANISTYIANAAIGSVQIGDAQVGTLQIAQNAATAGAFVSGSATSISTTLNLPANAPISVVAICYFGEGVYLPPWVTDLSCAVTIDGVTRIATAGTITYTPNSDYGATTYARASATIMASRVYTAGSSRTITISASSTTVKDLAVFAFYR